MSCEYSVGDIVTSFLLNTCRLRPLPGKYVAQVVGSSTELATGHPHDDANADLIPLITGSVAEFYIEPMLPHVGDIDVMFHRSTMLAIPRGHPPPTQLPAEFSDYVKVFEIVDSYLPGYVYLEYRYLLTECVDDDKYSCTEHDRWWYLPNRTYGGDQRRIHGPALLAYFSHTPALSVDCVRCVRCLSWPSQAADWPTRYRNYDWPDSATVDRVVNNGCDVVGVAHRQCRQYELMSKHQWRLSFSRAEIVLINSWMPVQQIVYHMLRVFVKTEPFANENHESHVSNYHIKTLMMWTCELKSSSFWTDELNLISICVELLHTLSVWLTHAQCPHYFINNCNLLDNSLAVELELIASQLMSVDEAWLSTWFINNYIRQCSMLCPDNVSVLFSDVSTNMKLQYAVSAVVNWRLNTALLDTWRVLDEVQCEISYHVHARPLTVQSCTCLMTELAKTGPHLPLYFTALAFLHVSYRISSISFTDKLVDVLATLAGQFISRRRHPSQCSSELSLSKATKLMKVVANSSRSTMQLIEIELLSLIHI